MNLSDFQSGHYEAQFEYKSFLPNLIHHAWVIADPEVQELLGQADRALGELNAFSQLVPDIDFFIKMYVAKEATQSSKIEGTQTNIEDAFKNVDEIAPEENNDWQEVQNYIQAINHSITKLQTLPLSTRLLKETHAILLQGVRGEGKLPGEFRISQNWIGVSLKNAVFVPPHHTHVINLMSDLEKFLHDEEFRVPPLIKIAIAHYQFETIHPFLDGNGRLGRLMISLFLASQGLLVKPSLYLSDFFERNKPAYIDNLMAVRHGNHLKNWLVFFLYGVQETAHSSIAVFKDIIKLKASIEAEILPRFAASKQDKLQKLIRELYARPVIDIKALAILLNVTPKTANTLVADLTKYGLLKEITGKQRNRLFIFQDYLSLFRK